MTGLLEGKVAIVTGSSRGLGFAVAKAFAAEGARVVVSGTTQEGADRAAAEIPGSLAIACDVSSEEQVEALVARSVDHFGALHLMVPNAGVVEPAPFLSIGFEEWRRTMTVNLDGVFLSMRHAAPAIIASGGGSIVAMCSASGMGGTPLLAAYAASKAAVLNLTKTVAVELRESGVRVNALVPGFIATDMVTDAGPLFDQLLGMPAGGFADHVVQQQGRFGTPEDVASAAIFLAADSLSSWTTGTGLVLDGGFTANLVQSIRPPHVHGGSSRR